MSFSTGNLVVRSAWLPLLSLLLESLCWRLSLKWFNLNFKSALLVWPNMRSMTINKATTISSFFCQTISGFCGKIYFGCWKKTKKNKNLRRHNLLTAYKFSFYSIKRGNPILHEPFISFTWVASRFLPHFKSQDTRKSKWKELSIRTHPIIYDKVVFVLASLHKRDSLCWNFHPKQSSSFCCHQIKWN